MRIISGEYKGRVLKSPPDMKIRPTSDRLRETIFNIIAPQLDDSSRVLDLCAGTGAIGIEAVSRGAAFVTFVDISRRSAALVEKNLQGLGVNKSLYEILVVDAALYLRKSKEQFDFIYYDPPYEDDYSAVLALLGEAGSPQLQTEGVLLVEHNSRKVIPDEIGELRRWRLLKQGDTSVSFFSRK